MKHSQVRNSIVETASALFYRNGYNSTGINEIIAESGIAKATLYNHFRSKEDICLAYLQYKNAAFSSEIDAFTKKRKAGKTRILGIFDFLSEFYAQKEFNGCWCIKTISEIPRDNIRIRKEIQSQKDQFITFISDLIKANSDMRKSSESKTMARQLYLLYESAVGESHLHRDSWPIKEAKKVASQILN